MSPDHALAFSIFIALCLLLSRIQRRTAARRALARRERGALPHARAVLLRRVLGDRRPASLHPPGILRTAHRRAGTRSEIGKTRWEIPYLEPDEEAWRKHRATLDAHLPFRDFELARPTPDGGKRYVSVSGMPAFDETGRFVGYRGVGRHITERKRAEAERRAHVWFLESMDRINRAMQGTNDLERMMGDVLDAVLDIFACDRAWLIYPCDPDAPSWRAVMERTRPQFPGALALQADLPVTVTMPRYSRRRARPPVRAARS